MSKTSTSFVSPGELVRLRAERADVRLLDVRAPEEFRAQRIEASFNVPLDHVEGHAAELRSESGPLVIVCRSGARACRAEEVLRASGVSDVHVLEGGVLAWGEAGHPTAGGR